MKTPALLLCLVLACDLSMWAAVADTPAAPEMRAVRDSATGQVLLLEGDRRVLQYNYAPIEPGALLAEVAEGNRIYARTRSDYIHPLWGHQGEVLTRDWAVDHPHHRGIYWAWPEVDYGKDRGDLHALQRVFARPTGRLRLRNGPDFAQLEAENEWRWEDRVPIVRERVMIRAARASGAGRVIDLAFEFLALEDGVTVARRNTDLYGGLNVRLATPRNQLIRTHTDLPEAAPRRAWSDLTGEFGSAGLAGLTLLQHASNPHYPGDWVQYPELSWCQPTFPAPKVRYPISRQEPLVLRYRLWVHAGPGPDDGQAAALWDAFHHPQNRLPSFDATAGESSSP